MIDQNNTHLFSLYAPALIDAGWSVGACVNIALEDVVHRIVKVLRLDVGSCFVFFDQHRHATVFIEKIVKRMLVVRIESITQNESIQPHVTFFLPLLKKEALEHAVYSLCELGINQIQLVVTEKSRQQLMGQKEFLRLQNIMIAAAEQSKHYAMTELLPAKKLSDVSLNISNQLRSLVFDPTGVSFFKLHEKIKDKSLVLLVGPEGGLTAQELQSLQDKKFYTCTLTSTTLRAVQAVVLGAGLARLQ